LSENNLTSLSAPFDTHTSAATAHYPSASDTGGRQMAISVREARCREIIDGY